MLSKARAPDQGSEPTRTATSPATSPQEKQSGGTPKGERPGPGSRICDVYLDRTLTDAKRRAGERRLTS